MPPARLLIFHVSRLPQPSARASGAERECELSRAVHPQNRLEEVQKVLLRHAPHPPQWG